MFGKSLPRARTGEGGDGYETRVIQVEKRFFKAII